MKFGVALGMEILLAILLDIEAFLVIAHNIIFMTILFYSDLVLAAITGNTFGSPSGDVAVLYWAYFIAHRLPMFA